jgi:hypothetical protein
LRVEDDHLLAYRVENQGCAVWGVDLTDPDADDPPVRWREYESHTWRPFLDRFSDACVEMVLSESIWSGPLELSANQQLEDASVAILEASYRRLAFPDYQMWADPDGPPVRWFAGPDVLLCDHSDTWLWAKARTAAAIDEVRHRIPGDWIMG